MRKALLFHSITSCSFFILFACLDSLLTLKGIDGNILLEGNPVIREMMNSFGIVQGLILQKSAVFIFCLLLALCCFYGIDKNRDWIYYFTLTRFSREYMKKKKRYWVAFLPIYAIAISQGFAAISWFVIIN